MTDKWMANKSMESNMSLSISKWLFGVSKGVFFQPARKNNLLSFPARFFSPFWFWLLCHTYFQVNFPPLSLITHTVECISWTFSQCYHFWTCLISLPVEAEDRAARAIEEKWDSYVEWIAEIEVASLISLFACRHTSGKRQVHTLLHIFTGLNLMKLIKP